MEPSEILVQAREDRDWTTFEAAKRAGVGDQTLRSLEDGKTEPGKARMETIIALVELYYPDVKLRELVPTRFEFQPATLVDHGLLIAGTSSKTLRRAMRRAASVNS